MKQGKLKKIGNVVGNVVLCVFLVLCILTVFMTVVSKKDQDGAAEIFGYQMRMVTSDSMAASEYTDVSEYAIREIPIRSMIFIKVMPEDPDKAEEWYRSLKVGDVLTIRYVYTTQVTITHRITSISEKESGGFMIELAGDNKNSENGQLTQMIDTSIANNPNYVIGKVVGQVHWFGVLMSFLMQPLGMVMIIIVPCLIIILIEVLKIIKFVTKEKKTREREEIDEKEREITELKTRLEALEKESSEKTEEEAGEKEGKKE